MILLADALFLEQYFFRIKRFTIGDPGKRGRSIRWIHLTDLHLENHAGPKYRKLAATINRFKPDLLFMTGDAIDKTGKLSALDEFMWLLDPELVKVAVPGNHEYKSGEDPGVLEEICQKHHCFLLVNESRPFEVQGQRIMVTGLDDMIEGEANFREAVKNVGNEKNHIVLIHSPLHYEKILPQIEQINASRPGKDKLNISYFLRGIPMEGR